MASKSPVSATTVVRLFKLSRLDILLLLLSSSSLRRNKKFQVRHILVGENCIWDNNQISFNNAGVHYLGLCYVKRSLSLSKARLSKLWRGGWD